MQLYFSEYKSDYGRYIFPYAIWAVPDENEPVHRLFARGFLPSSPDLDRFYMCRHVRVPLAEYAPGSENRRILRKGDIFSFRLLARKDFEFTARWQRFCKSFADTKFGKDTMSEERLNRIFHAPIVSHLMVFTHDNKDVGLVVLYLDKPDLAFYYYAFYDLDYFKQNLGMYMMTCTVGETARLGYGYIYLGSCYSRNAMYKTQFKNAEFFNGFRWSENMKELKYLVRRDQAPVTSHLMETPEFRSIFYPGGPEKSAGLFRVKGS